MWYGHVTKKQGRLQVNKHSVFVPERNKQLSTYWVKNNSSCCHLCLYHSAHLIQIRTSPGVLPYACKCTVFCIKSYHSLLTKPGSNITRISYAFVKLRNHHNVRHYCINIYNYSNHSCKYASTCLTSTFSFPWSKADLPSVASISQAVNNGNYILFSSQ